MKEWFQSVLFKTDCDSLACAISNKVLKEGDENYEENENG